MKIHINAKKIFIAIFSCIIICPMLFQGIYYIAGTRLDTELKGYFDQEDKPRLTLSDFISGDFQTRYDKWLNANMLPRPLLRYVYPSSRNHI